MDELCLPSCLGAIRSTLPEAKIIAIDGAYASWIKAIKMEAALNYDRGLTQLGDDLLRFDTPISTDKTKEICRNYGVEVYVDPPQKCCGQYMPWESEAKKRNEFFKHSKPGDWWYMVDSDEGVQGHPDELRGNCYSVMLQRDDDIAPYQVMRIWRHPESNNIKIEGSHHALWIDNVLYKNPEQTVIGGTKLRHFWNKRAENDRVRHMAKGAYYRAGLGPEEQDFRAIHGI
jgi:hypothetical protein